VSFELSVTEVNYYVAEQRRSLKQADYFSAKTADLKESSAQNKLNLYVTMIANPDLTDKLKKQIKRKIERLTQELGLDELSSSE
jgi:predicted DNA-binding protein YlxM (UPF0122 family)